MKTHDRQITDLLQAVDSGAAQLPDFQRSWVWDDGRIKSLILSVIRKFPVGAAMFLDYGNANVRFKYRIVEGVPLNRSNVTPSELILDGQQRLTSLYSALYSDAPVRTRTDKGKDISLYYYISIEKALDPNADDEEIIISVPEDRILKSSFGRIDLDLSRPENEYEHKMFPLNRILDLVKVMTWQSGYQSYYNFAPDAALFDRFSREIITKTLKY